MFIYTLSILLTSTAFVSTNAKIRHTSFEIYRISENCPLGYAPNARLFLLLKIFNRIEPLEFEEFDGASGKPNEQIK